MKEVLVLTLLFFSFMPIYATTQNTQYTLKGKVRYAKNKNAVSYATVGLYRRSSLVRGVLTDASGVFTIKNLSNGKYTVRISVLGCDTCNLSLFVSGDTDVGDLYLKENSTALKEVVIESKRVPVLLEGDRIVVDVHSYMNTGGKTAIDVIKSLPGVIADNASFSVLGKNSIVYLNGKKVRFSEAYLVQFLNSLHADQIEKVELVTNPSSKYEAGDNGAIVNIVLKKDVNLGWNGSGSMIYGIKKYGEIYLPGFDFNYRSDKLNIYGNYSLNYGKYKQTMDTERKYWNVNPAVEYDQYGDYRPGGTTNNALLGMDYNVRKNQMFGVMLSGGNYIGGNRNYSRTYIHRIGDATIDSTILSPLRMDINSKNLSTNLNYKWDIDPKGSSLNADLNYSYVNEYQQQDMQNNYYDMQGEKLRPSEGNFHSVLQIMNAIEGDIDYEGFVMKKWKIETGLEYEGVRRRNDMKTGVSPGKSGIVDNFRYTEQIAGAYVNVSKTLGRLSVMAGLRMESTWQRGREILMDSLFKKQYSELFPSFRLAYDLGRGNTLRMSYARKINRPTFSMLNPFKFYTSPQESIAGNPNLSPNYTDSWEMSCSHGSMSFYLMYTKNKGGIILEPYQNDYTKEVLNTYKNFGKDSRYGIFAYVPFSLLKGWSLHFNGSAYYVSYQSKFMGTDYAKDFAYYYVSLANNVNLGKGFSLDLSGWYISPRWNIVSKFKSCGQMDLSIDKSILKGKGKLSLFAADPFRWNKDISEQKYGNIDSYYYNVPDIRMIRLGFSYNFGSENIKGRRNRKTGMEEIDKRM